MKKKLSLLILTLVLWTGVAHALPEAQQDHRVQKIYEHFQHSLLWIEGKEWTPCAATFFEVLSRAEEHGLWGENYLPVLHHLQESDLSTPEKQKEADALLTFLALTYIAEMKGKRLDPHKVDKTIFEKPEPVDEMEVLRAHLSPPHRCGWPLELAPANEEYQQLKDFLAHYRQKQAQGGWPQLPEGTTLEEGDKGPLVKTLKMQLVAQDALSPEEQEGDVFDKTVTKAVELYQTLHGLEKDGKVGGETLKELNTPIEERIHKIIVSLERHRWLPSPLPLRYIQVNIPGFYLKAVNKETSFTMPIITGKEYRKTPVFDTSLTDIVLNPSWHVPFSIAVRDKLPQLRTNPHALTHKGYRFYNASGTPVSPGAVNWSLYSAKYFPIKIVQSPGEANALGKIRFTLQNPFAIYMHGTPEKKLFQKTKRALSSGCIRVEDPIKLAEFVLNDAEKWAAHHIEKASSGTTTKRIKLDEPLPVFVTYFTVFRHDEAWHIVHDNYKQDTKVLKALEKTKQEE